MTGRSRKQNISEIVVDLNDINQLDLIAAYEILHLATVKYKFLRLHRAFTKIDHILGHKNTLIGIK